ncbi:MAG TPA: beta-ketoacyl synthase chain length factor [Puia sp.]|nr:beta-ketoacyl synthase chain length factor [Puia sp.]
MNLYIRSTGNISPQDSLHPEKFFAGRITHDGNRMNAVEPDYTQFVDSKMIRRMSHIVKMGVSAALSCLKSVSVSMPEAIITGTAYGCLEDTDVFLRRMIENKEELLTPTAFIQSTHNTVGAQIALLLKCHAYNNTIVHRGFSFENALLDASLLIAEGLDNILVGGIDEIIPDSHAILSRFGIYRSENSSPSKGAIAGEGAAFFLLSGKQQGNEMACIKSMSTLYKPANLQEIENAVQQVLQESGIGMKDIDLVLPGHNGDHVHDQIDELLAGGLFQKKPAFPFKSLCGEYPTATGFACWLAALLIKEQSVPEWFSLGALSPKNILIHNHDLTGHYSLMLVSACSTTGI